MVQQPKKRWGVRDWYNHSKEKQRAGEWYSHNRAKMGTDMSKSVNQGRRYGQKAHVKKRYKRQQ